MRTVALLSVLLPLSLFGQGVFDQYRALRPDEIDPYQVFIYERPIGGFKHPGGGDACVILAAIKETGELVRIAGSMQLCGHPFAKGMEMNFSPRLLLPDSVQ